MRNPRICFISLNMYHVLTKDKAAQGIGGAEVQLLKIADEFMNRGCDVSFITLDHDPNELMEHPYKLIKAFDRKQGIRGVRFLYPRVYKIWKALKESNADVFYLNMASFVLGIVVAFAKTHKKRVVFCASIDSDFEPERIPVPTAKDKQLYIWGINNCDKIIVQNTHQLQTLKNNFQLEGELIHYGAPKQKMSEQKVIIWVASIKQKKHPELFVELARRNPQEKFVMIGGKVPKGDAESDAFYDKIYAETKTVPNLDYKGFLPFAEAEKWFDRAKMFINTSDIEGFPMTFLQSWSRGIPVITFVGPDNLIRQNKLGAVAENFENMHQIVNGFSQGRVGFSNIHIKQYFEENLTIERTVDKIEHIFQTIIV